MEANNMDEIEIKLKEEGKIRRLTDKTFQLDERIKDGYFSANYFLKTRKIVAHNAPGHLVEEQWFQRRNDSMVCGIDECIAILHKFATHPETLGDLGPPRWRFHPKRRTGAQSHRQIRGFRLFGVDHRWDFGPAEQRCDQYDGGRPRPSGA
jgi:hypothetical protein